MKKFDTFKTLTQGVKSFVAMLLVTVMAVGSVIAQTNVTTTFSENGYENAQAVTTVVMDANITRHFLYPVQCERWSCYSEWHSHYDRS